MRGVRWVLFLVAGCYAPTPLLEGVPCGPDLSCPEPLMCSFGQCVSEAPACMPIEDGLGKLAVPRVASPIEVDGNLEDWQTCFVTVDLESAGLVRDLGAGGRFASGRFSVVAAADRLYVAAEVQIVAPLGDRPPPEVYLNNAISVYFDGDGEFTTARYDPDATQIVVDHANRTQGFRSGTGLAAAPQLQSATTVDATTFTIEMSVTPATFGIMEFGSPIGFDIGLVGGDGETMTSELVWFQACREPQCGCSNNDDAPYCDSRQFGTVTITP